MRQDLGSLPYWKRRPIFVWQVRVLTVTLALSILSWLPTLIRSSFFIVLASPFSSATKNLPENPCLNRPTPAPLPSDSPPTLFFLHIPKTAGTLMYRVAIQYANRTNGLACSYVYDGNRAAPSEYSKAPVPMSFDPGTKAAQALEAIAQRDREKKTRLLAEGACRTLRGHVTYRTAHAVRTPVVAMTIVRDPLARFVSMYEFVISMLKSRPNVTGWDRWLGGSKSLAGEFANSSSIFHRGFYDDAGKWIASQNIGFSFHFYGVLHQLSGLTPRFEGVQDPYHFRMRNDAEMAEAAKDNLCKMHILGSQEDMEETWLQFFTVVRPYANWTEQEKNVVNAASVNRTPGRISRNVDDHLPQRIRDELERRLQKEVEVVDFARKIIAYRKWLRESAAES